MTIPVSGSPVYELRAKDIGHSFGTASGLFSDITISIKSGETCVITGSNGSGKSTLLKILAGQRNPQKGSVELIRDNVSLSHEIWYKYFAWSGPWNELYSEYSPLEFIKLWFSFKSSLHKHPEELLEILNLTDAANQPAKQLSSGMMQRLKTGLVLTSDVPLLFLDEPGIMLDNQNKQLFKSLLSTYLNNRMLVLASNDESDWSGLTIHHRIDLKHVTV